MTITKVFNAPATELGPRRVRVQCSSNAVDRAGEVVEQQGVTYAKSLPVLWSHDPGIPVGRAYPGRDANGNLIAEVEFAPDGVSAKADEICGLVKAGVIDTVSIGFDPLDIAPMDPSKPRGPQRYKASEWLELSFVSVPANRDAQVTERSMQTTGDDDMAARADRVSKAVTALGAKGMWGVACLADTLADLGWQREMAEFETASEGDNSPVPAMLADALRVLADAFLAMAKEEVAELLGDPGEDVSTDELEADEAAFVTAGKTPAARKMRIHSVKLLSGRITLKSGKTISAATGAALQTALAAHDEAAEHHKAAAKCMKVCGEQIKSLLETGADDSADDAADDGAAPPDTDDIGGKSHTDIQTFRRRARLVALGG